MTFWAVVVSGQRKQLTTDFQRRQAKETPHGLWADLLQASMQAQHRVLHDVIRLFPAMDVGECPQQFSRQTAQPIAGVFQQVRADPRYRRLSSGPTSLGATSNYCERRPS